MTALERFVERFRPRTPDTPKWYEDLEALSTLPFVRIVLTDLAKPHEVISDPEGTAFQSLEPLSYPILYTLETTGGLQSLCIRTEPQIGDALRKNRIGIVVDGRIVARDNLPDKLTPRKYIFFGQCDMTTVSYPDRAAVNMRYGMRYAPRVQTQDAGVLLIRKQRPEFSTAEIIESWRDVLEADGIIDRPQFSQRLVKRLHR